MPHLHLGIQYHEKHCKQKTERAWDVSEDRRCRYATRVPNIITMISLGARTHRASINLAEDGGTTQRICILDDTGFAIMIQRHGLAKSQMCLFIRHKLSRSRAEERAARVVLDLVLDPPGLEARCQPMTNVRGESRSPKSQSRNATDHLGIPRLLWFVPILLWNLHRFLSQSED